MDIETLAEQVINALQSAIAGEPCDELLELEVALGTSDNDGILEAIYNAVDKLESMGGDIELFQEELKEHEVENEWQDERDEESE